MEANEFSEILRIVDVSLQHLPLRFYHVNLKTKRESNHKTFFGFINCLVTNFEILMRRRRFSLPECKTEDSLSEMPCAL